MNVTLPKKVKYSIKDKIVYIVAVSVCILSIACIAYLEISSNTGIVKMLDTSEAEAKMLGNKTDEEKEALKAIINNKFNNNIEKKSVSNDIKKLDNSKDIICTAMNIQDSKSRKL